MDVAEYNELPIAVLMSKQQLKALVDRLPDNPSDDLKRVGEELIYNDIMWNAGEEAFLIRTDRGEEWVPEAMNLVAMLAARLTGLWEGDLFEIDVPILLDKLRGLVEAAPAG